MNQLDNLQLRFIGKDAVGLSDTSEVDGITIEITYPLVQNIVPEPGRLISELMNFTSLYLSHWMLVQSQVIIYWFLVHIHQISSLS